MEIRDEPRTYFITWTVFVSFLKVHVTDQE